jgi:hypothetical protein
MVTLDLILAELDRATEKFPTWPTDPLHALAVLGEEYGELNKAMLQLVYEPHKTDAQQVRAEAIQTAAMALRLAMSLGEYEYLPSKQHKQEQRQHSDDAAVDRFAVAMKKKWRSSGQKDMADGMTLTTALHATSRPSLPPT